MFTLLNLKGKRLLQNNLFCGSSILLLLLIFPLHVHAVPPTPPATIELDEKEVKGELREARGEINMPINIKAKEDVKDIEISVSLRQVQENKLPARWESFLRQNIKPSRNKSTKTAIPIKINGPGHYEISIFIKGEINKDNAFSDRKTRHIIVDQQGSYRILTGKQLRREQKQMRQKRFEEQLKREPNNPDIRLLFGNTVRVPDNIASEIKRSNVPPEKQLEVRPAGLSETLKKYSIDKTSESWTSKDPITVRGRITFQDFNGNWQPLVNVSVNLWDDDFGADEHLGVTVTDWDGNWSFSVNNDDGFWQDGRDIYYSFKLENTRIRVQDCDGIDSTYEWESDVHDDLSDGTVVDFGSETAGSDENTLRIWSYLNLAWNHASTAGGQDPGFVDTCYPEDGGTHWDRFWEEIDIEDEFDDGPDVVTHEYGHAVMWYAYGDDNPSPGGSHTFDDCPQDAGLAWSEGWATGFMLSARPDGTYTWHEGGGSRNIENFNATCRTGERNEGRVAAAINDMIDSPDDCNGGNEDRGRNSYCDDNNANRAALSTMLRDTLWGNWHDDFLDFWNSLSGELPAAQAAPAHRIMYYNWMGVSEPVSCVATKITTAKRPDQDAILGNLRKFRDNALKPSIGGRRIISIYYRNSPEIAEILMKDEKLKESALRVLTYFAKVGEILTNNKAYQKSSGSGNPFISDEIIETVQSVIGQLEAKGSASLKQNLAEIRNVFDKVKGLTLDELSQKVNDAKNKRQGERMPQLHQSILNPASEKAKKNLRNQFMDVRPPEDLRR